MTKKLQPLKFTPFTSKEIKPTGWLRKQLEIQAKGLSGNLDKVWPDVRDSMWIGGTQEAWERAPYWLDGFIPLAYLLDDDDMKARAKKYIDAIIERQKPDGWICPCTDEERKNYDVWALFLICKVFVLYHECSADERMERAVYDALKNLNRHIEMNTIFDWAATRWYECLIPLYWLYEKCPEDWMIDLALKLYSQGTDYKKVFDIWVFEKPYEKDRWSFMTHVVNLAMCLKQDALITRLIGGCPNEFAKKALSTLLRDHGMAVGHFTGDECLSGNSPIQGSECCSVTEAMYSYEHLLSITGDPDWADKLENLAFNALPATISPDMWAHQYDQMTNQVECSTLPEGHVIFKTNGPESHLFGLEPNYGCCTANFNQGFPKFALSTFMKTEKGIAITVLSPSTLNTVINDVPVCCEIITDYPFRNTVKIKVTADRAVNFELTIRVPSFAKSAQIDGTSVQTGFHTISKEFSNDEINLVMEFETAFEKRPNDMVALRRGPLLYSIAIKEDWRKLEYTRSGVERKFPYCDYEIYPMSKWNYAYTSAALEVVEKEFGEYPFSPEGVPIEIMTDMAEIDWGFANGVCSAQPNSRVAIATEKVRLIPYGATSIRMTEVPKI